MIKGCRIRTHLLLIGAFTLGAVCSSLSADDHQVAFAVKGTAEVDGAEEAAWESAPEILIDQHVKAETQIRLTETARGVARALWDDQFIYLLIDVNDQTLSDAAPQPWEQDSVEVFFDAQAERNEAYDDNDLQLRISYLGAVTGSREFDPQFVRSAVVKTDEGYRVELAINLEQLRPNDEGMGFELQINDDPNIGARRAIVKWHAPSNDAWRNPATFGTMRLVEEWNESTTAATSEQAAVEPRRTENAPAAAPLTVEQRVPDWAADAIFYQIFPERFRNGDTSNDPTRDTLEFADSIPENWAVTRWTSDWYARAAWEQELGDDFYENGVFHRRYGGDLQGVIDKLEYLKALGVNTLYFNPVFYARSLHKYDGNSYHHVDPYFGPDPAGDLAMIAEETSDPKTWKWTAADQLFLELIKAAHRNEMRVIIDGVFNHTGRDFFAFADLAARQSSSDYRSWYVVKEFDDPETSKNEFEYQCWWGVTTLPEFANSKDGQDLHPAPKKYIFDATRRWMDPNGDGNPNDGIDGWRLDVANEVPDQFWRDWNRLVREINSQAYTVAEIWQDAASYLERCGFSAAMNYHGFAYPVKGFLIDDTLTAGEFVDQLAERRSHYDARVQYGLQNLIDSHDTDRVASMIINARHEPYAEPQRFDYDVGSRASPRHDPNYDVSKPQHLHMSIQKLVAMFQMTYVGAPMIYYGTEAGMWGGDDPCDRKPMLWEDLVFDAETSDPLGRQRVADVVAFDDDLFEFYANLIRLRLAHPAARRGTFEGLDLELPKDLLMYRRQFEQDQLLVILNRSQTPVSIDIARQKLGAVRDWRIAMRSGEADMKLGDGPETVQLSLGALSGMILEAAN